MRKALRFSGNIFLAGIALIFVVTGLLAGCTEQPAATPEPQIPQTPTEHYLENKDVLLKSDILEPAELKEYFDAVLRAYRILEDLHGRKAPDKLIIELTENDSGALSWFIGGKPSAVKRDDAHNIMIASLAYEVTRWYLDSLDISNQIWFEEGLADYIAVFAREGNPDNFGFTAPGIPHIDWYKELKTRENLFQEMPEIKNAHSTGDLFFIFLETDYGFDYSKVKEMIRALAERRDESGRSLDAFDIKDVAEEIAGKPLDDLYEFLAPGIEFNSHIYK
jgi:hypothetical protein